MKLLSREFSFREKVLIVILVVIVIVLGFIVFIRRPISESTTEAQNRISELETENTLLLAQAAKYTDMADEIEKIQEESGPSYLPSYNNSKEEVNFLNSILSKADTYTVSFTKVTRNSNLIRRSFSVNYTASTYDQAMDILKELDQCEYRCILGEVNVSSSTTKNVTTYAVATVGTFYETMADGTADSALPEDSDNKSGSSTATELDDDQSYLVVK